MRSIKPIPKDEQIYNTYGNLPNSDLLRRYGYVIPDSADDLVEISTDSIVETINRHSAEEMRRRLDLLEDEDLIEEYVAKLLTLLVGHMRSRILGKYPESFFSCVNF